MKSVLSPPTVGDGIRQGTDDFRELDDRARPAVRDQDRERPYLRRALMNEVCIEAIDDRLVVVERIQTTLLLPPIELVAPVLDERRHVVEVGAIVPAHPVELVRQPGTSEPLLEVVQYGLRYVDHERPHGIGIRWRRRAWSFAGGPHGGCECDTDREEASSIRSTACISARHTAP